MFALWLLSGCGSADRSSELEGKVLNDSPLLAGVELNEQDSTHYSGTVTYRNGQTGTIAVTLEWTGDVTYRRESISYEIQPN